MSTNDSEQLLICLQRLKTDTDNTLMEYLEFQRFNLSLPLLGVRHPNTHLLDLDDIMDTLNLIDKYKKNIRNSCREFVTKDEVKLAHHRLINAQEDPSHSRINGQYTIPGYCLTTKKAIQHIYLVFTRSAQRLDQIIAQITNSDQYGIPP
jgi:hypothetical protein